MTYLIRFEGSFATKEEAIAFANLIEGIKGNFVQEERTTFKPEFEVQRRCQIWESTHDEANPQPCKLLTSVDFSGAELEHKIDGVTPSAELVLSSKILTTIKTPIAEVK
jgi:hypothetical protein